MSLWLSVLHAVVRSRRFFVSLILFSAVLITGTVGYLIVSKPNTHWIDALYMTVITITTIGYGETVEFTHSHTGRVFTMVLALLGIAVMGYVFTATTSFILELRKNPHYQRQRLQMNISSLHQHYIVCGAGRIGSYIVDELIKTKRPFVVIDSLEDAIHSHKERTGHTLAMAADATDDDVLQLAGIDRSAGVFAVTGDDSRNLVISLSVKQVSPGVRVVARVHDKRNIEKTRRAGADEIVSPDFTGGMRIASAMIRPQTVAFLDKMLEHDKHLRVEDINVPLEFKPRPLNTIDWPTRDHLLLMAVRRGSQWFFNPAPDFSVQAKDVLVAMTDPQGREYLEKFFARAANT